ncbi:MAG: hypothetical protein RMJ19_03545 [Gemmatales bacterium]|nr:hypothetical protein [Gemmatales bacterium]MDW8174720.1 hypothetical protein [Gemmatales bacterium]
MAESTHVCPKCQRVNPSEATYCYFDGAVLVSMATMGYGPLNVANLPFPRPFVFASGRMCRTFNELVIGCIQEWQAAKELLTGGYLESFLGGIGRLDLATAARQAAQFPDPDRGLDQLLSRLPCDKEVVKPAKLAVEPLQINLGTLSLGEDSQFELHISNQGMRLLYGDVFVENTPWLLLGEAPGVQEKAFKCEREIVIPVRVVGNKLRASLKPLTGKIVVSSNVGKAEVTVQVQVPVKPFPEGILKGAQTPRQLAELTMKQPKEAAIYFESGKVKEWYEANGWSYGVQGPAANGLAAVQQFLEACGWTTPPRVVCETEKVELEGPVNGKLEFTVRVRGLDAKPVFAWGVSNQPWLVPGKANCSGRTATIPVSVPQIPPPQNGDTLTAELLVTSNGRTKFTVPVTVRVRGSVAPPATPRETAPTPVVFTAGVAQQSGVSPPGTPAPSEPVPAPSSPFDFGAASLTELSGTRARAGSDGVQVLDEEQLASVPVRRRRSDTDWLHLMPLTLLLLVLAGLVIFDVFRRPSTSRASADKPPLPPDWEVQEQLDDTPYLRISFNPNQGYRQRFGIAIPAQSRKDDKALTFMDRDEKTGVPSNPGRTSNLVVRYEGKDFIFGRRGDGQPSVAHVRAHSGRKAQAVEDGYMPIQVIVPGEKHPAYQSIFIYSEEKERDPQGDPLGIRVTQEVSLRRSDVSRKYEVVLVRFLVENTGSKPRKVGLRYMLDTFIGSNDGVPFLIPGQDRLIQDKAEFRGQDIPQFVQALERPDLNNPGTVAHLLLRLPEERYEPPERVVIAAWPDSKLGGRCKGPSTEWEPEFHAMNDKRLGQGDSAVFIYWAEKVVAPDEKREMGFAYGLGHLAAASAVGGKTQLAITVSGGLRRRGLFTVTAYVANPERGQPISLNLPPGFRIVQGESPRPVPAAVGRYIPVSWRVEAPDQLGEFELSVQLGNLKQAQKIRLADKSFLD